MLKQYLKTAYCAAALIMSFQVVCIESVQAAELKTDDACNHRQMAGKAFYISDKNHDYKLTKTDGKSWEKYKNLDTDGDESVSFNEFTAGADLPYPEWDGKVMRNVVYKQVDDRVLLLDIYEPQVQKYDKAPVFYYTHGGGWTGGTKELSGNPEILFKALSREGFVCISVMYRLVKMGNPKNNVIMRDCIVDSRDGLRFLKKHEDELGIDLSKVVVFGASAGGHIAQLLTWSGPDDFAGDPSLAEYKVAPIAGVSWYGPCDFRDTNLFVSAGVNDKFAPDYWANRITKQKGKFTYNGADDKTRQMIEEVSPVCWLKSNSAPLLHMHGDQDPVISLKQAQHLEATAKRIGAPVDVIYVKGGNHGWYSRNLKPDVKTINKITVDYILNQVRSTK
jgi:acetyl esterase/lipase